MTLREVKTLRVGDRLKPTPKLEQSGLLASWGIFAGMPRSGDPKLIRVRVDGRRKNEIWHMCFWNKAT